MSKIDLGTSKYVIHAKIEASGVVEKPDVVGAIFGQSEGLLGNDLDLRELQKTGRIGRIEVKIESKGGKSVGEITIPSSLDKADTSLLAATLEAVDRVGPCEAKISLKEIEDVRTSKRKRILERAKDILSTMMEDITPDTLEITEELKKSIRLREIEKYGSDQLPAGPNVDDSDAIIIVEGRADVLNLLKNGIKNVIAVEGTSIPQTIINLTREKTATAFIDGDRGGELILKELLQVADLDYIARAPEGKEVEELTKKEIFKSLRNKLPAEQGTGGLIIARRKVEKEPEVKKTPVQAAKAPKIEDKNTKRFRELYEDLSGSLKAYILDKDANIIKEVAVRDLVDALKNTKEGVSAVLFDGVITQRMVEIASDKKVEYLVGAKIGNITKKPEDLRLFTIGDLS